jgi:hypothetical protein
LVPGSAPVPYQQRQQVGSDGITGCSPITALVTHGNGWIDGSLAWLNMIVALARQPGIAADLAVANHWSTPTPGEPADLPRREPRQSSVQPRA